jgi:hypothetical protein
MPFMLSCSVKSRSCRGPTRQPAQPVATNSLDRFFRAPRLGEKHGDVLHGKEKPVREWCEIKVPVTSRGVVVDRVDDDNIPSAENRFSSKPTLLWN